MYIIIIEKKKSRMSQNSRENFYEETDQELHISGNTGTIPEETIFGSNKVKEQHETMKLQNEEVMLRNFD